MNAKSNQYRRVHKREKDAEALTDQRPNKQGRQKNTKVEDAAAECAAELRQSCEMSAIIWSTNIQFTWDHLKI